ncbi:hypothetical protein [Polynucleobacter sp. MG-27-Goln-C1]|uniref:hypothetical protein n=1 Tax=Polynucleobacter sp. MG-27-Goln-C1 TaxID=1819726 RepID=UPI001C0C3AE2|nr:hypothetical protein [Polynucleobacter sp. MG-27-Goln-C1]MBU3612941.1 hypothetical protein [Polynucleobacter sp. MG-27-Goln-C1]
MGTQFFSFKRLFVLPLFGCLFATCQLASAQQAPNLIGTWVGETNDAVIGAGTHYPNGKSGEIRFLKSVVTYKFDQQKNRAFSGTFSIAGHTVPIVGSVSADMVSGAMADQDGTYSFKVLNPNQLAVCFATTTTVPKNKDAGPVADCHEVTRK